MDVPGLGELRLVQPHLSLRKCHLQAFAARKRPLPSSLRRKFLQCPGLSRRWQHSLERSRPVSRCSAVAARMRSGYLRKWEVAKSHIKIGLSSISVFHAVLDCAGLHSDLSVTTQLRHCCARRLIPEHQRCDAPPPPPHPPPPPSERTQNFSS